MIRKSIIFPIEKALETEEDMRLKRTYEALCKVQGICKDPKLNDASSTIDEVLYGENGAWKGSNELQTTLYT